MRRLRKSVGLKSFSIAERITFRVRFFHREIQHRLLHLFSAHSNKENSGCMG